MLLNKIGEVLRLSSVIGKSLGLIRIQITKRGVGVSDLGDLAYGCLWQGRRDDKGVHIHLFITLFLTCRPTKRLPKITMAMMLFVFIVDVKHTFFQKIKNTKRRVFI